MNRLSDNGVKLAEGRANELLVQLCQQRENGHRGDQSRGDKKGYRKTLSLTREDGQSREAEAERGNGERCQTGQGGESSPMSLLLR
jgi:hypothetical protein